VLLVHEVATQVFNWEMAVWLEQRQSHPLLEEQEDPSQLPMQSDQEQDGSQAKDVEANNAAANAKDFILEGLLWALKLDTADVASQGYCWGRRPPVSCFAGGEIEVRYGVRVRGLLFDGLLEKRKGARAK